MAIIVVCLERIYRCEMRAYYLISRCRICFRLSINIFVI